MRFTNCENKKAYSTIRDFYIIDTLHKSIDTLKTSKKGIGEFELLNTENKVLEYKNKFNQRIQINLASLSPYTTNNLCCDSLKYTHLPYIDQLKESDTLNIKFHSRGCFHMDSCELLITKRNSEIQLELYKKGKISKSKILSDQDLIAFRVFEMELINHYMTWGGCTTNDDYIITFKSIKRHIGDDSCNWNGMHNLLILYGLQEK